MTAVAYDVQPDLATSRRRGAFDPLVPPENAVEQTSRIPIIRTTDAKDLVRGTGFGWFWPLWHRFDEKAKQHELTDPKSLHGHAGDRWVFAECGMVACPDESIVAASSSRTCPVCFPDDSGHLFVWDRTGGHTVARCLMADCEKTDAQTRDSNTGRRRSCKDQP